MLSNPLPAYGLKTKNACLTRRQHGGVPPLQGERSTPLQAAAIKKAVLKVAMLTRVFIDNGISPEDAGDLYESFVLPGFIDTAPEADKPACELVDMLSRWLSQILMESPDTDEIIRAVRDGNRPGYIRELLQKSFAMLDFETNRTAQLQASLAEKQILRYLRWELRTPEFAKPKTINIFGQEIEGSPDFIFDDGMGQIEVVKIRFKKPDVTQGGRKRDASATNNLELYFLWRYGETLCESGVTQNVVASFTYMRRADDQSGNFQTEFHLETVQDGGKNIVTLAAETTADGDYSSDFHQHFKELLDDFLLGVSECSGTDCQTCDFCKICTYKKAPLELPEEENTRSVSDIVLTPGQEKAVYLNRGVARLNAGAGAGKTLTLALHVATLLSDGVEPSHILCVTYTNAGAAELKARIISYNDDLETGADATKVVCTTFNGLGNDIIISNYEDLGFSDEPRLIDDVERKNIIAELLRTTTIDGLDYERFACDFPSCKGALAVTCEAFDVIKRCGDSFPEPAALKTAMAENYASSILNDKAYEELIDLFFKYDEQLRNRNLIEFADQENLLLELLAEDPYLWDDFSFEHIIVDEFQDSSPMQLDLLQQLVECPDFKCLMVAGDDSQAIFSFRGAAPENIIDFFDKLKTPEADQYDISIMENHRSTPEILDFANKINAKNKKRVLKDLVATRASGAPVTVKGFHNSADEYKYICDAVKDKLDAGTPPEDIAVFAATRNELLSMADALTERGIEAVLLCPEPMLENSRVQAGIALAHFITDPRETEAIAVYLNGVADGELLTASDEDVSKQIEDMVSWVYDTYRTATPAQKAALFNEKLTAIDPGEADSIFQNFKERLDLRRAVRDKIAYAKMFEQYGGEAVKRPGKYPGVVLSTVHSSKGLEWPVVFVSLSKFDKGVNDSDIQEERRRLMFVAATRARDELFVTGLYMGRKRANWCLHECFSIAGLEWDPVDHEKEARMAAKRAANAARRSRIRKKNDPAPVLGGQSALF